ncbi:class F sortase [Salipaludibacillus sp. LMS25]|jgi:LPXTG-site transpeptidase (sortase) family protein|uniref:class F sortase n=1 Tax=Salipaludibacillus sp. LMS25 TaxID=2924031 RepID=UPI0020D1052B|nr:class F sortase [Salipaludibacillus sp. LMS25]UTR14226.1 class F sortase [Salipaludibacillus sp. LMS25]
MGQPFRPRIITFLVVLVGIVTLSFAPHIESAPQSVGDNGIQPVMIQIPKLGITAEVIPCHLNKDGSMEVPERGELAGWMTNSSMPGAKGNAVIAGHVDDFTGPAVFFTLKNLEQGDDIVIKSEYGSTLTFEVTKIEVYPNNHAPIDTIFGYASRPKLNLVTCHGLFDRKRKTHEERLVVYTELKHHEEADLAAH